MRGRWLVCYDISDPKRLRRVYRTLRGYGDWLQLSTFRCELSEREKVVLRNLLSEELNHEEDQVLFVYLGPAEGRGAEAIEGLGRPLLERKRVNIL
ncbi:MAG TPA: CRISPR-associated endonuclease Cas2 [Myxococcales bacterium]|jgi:CRISPR-associated protein Cas2|nr:CRISPR-associated endonuclease Cas2 [Myxococcales bacterium]